MKKEVLLLRISFYLGFYLLICPLLLKKDLSSLKPIGFLFLGVLVMLLCNLIVEAPFFRNYYENQAVENPE